MTAEQYRSWSAPFQKHSGLKAALVWYNRVFTVAAFLAYLAALIALLALDDARFLRVLCIPAVALAVLTVMRSLLNRPRPYEVLDITPLIDKKKSGNSFPSRHVFCAFTIATTLLYLCIPAGIAAYVLSAILAVSRVIAGVHFPSDVIGGALLGTALTAAGLYLPLPFPA